MEPSAEPIQPLPRRQERRAPARVVGARLLLAGALLLVLVPPAWAQSEEVARDCREWADGFFGAPSPRKESAIARCIAERDPSSPQALELRETMDREQAARAAREAEARQAFAQRLALWEREARARCDDELVRAFGPLHFCDEPEAVRAKVEASETLACVPAPSCARIELQLGGTKLTAYPKYSRDGLTRLLFYAPERDGSRYQTLVREDWQRVVSELEAVEGPPSENPTGFPEIFAVEDGVYFLYTHVWRDGRRVIRAGVCQLREHYAATLTVEDAARVSARGPGFRAAERPAWGGAWQPDRCADCHREGGGGVVQR